MRGGLPGGITCGCSTPAKVPYPTSKVPLGCLLRAVPAAGEPVWKLNFGRLTPSTRCCLRSCVCSTAWSFQAIDATLSQPDGALVIRCDACGADLPVLYTRCDSCFGCQNGTPFMCVSCGLRHRRRHRDISAVAKQSISEVGALATKCASLCGAPPPDFMALDLTEREAPAEAAVMYNHDEPNVGAPASVRPPPRVETYPLAGPRAVHDERRQGRRGNALRLRSRLRPLPLV